MIWYDGYKPIIGKCVVEERQNIGNYLAPRNLLRLYNLRRKPLTGIHIFRNLHFFPNLTMLCSKRLCLMKEWGKRMSHELISGATKEIYVAWIIGDLETPQNCVVEGWRSWNRTHWRWAYKYNRWIEQCGADWLLILNIQSSVPTL